jgi:hypothetical protein
LAEVEPRRKFAYKPEEIVVEKRSGKRTATAFCSFRSRCPFQDFCPKKFSDIF